VRVAERYERLVIDSELGNQEDAGREYLQTLLKSPSTKNTGVLGRTTASEFLEPANAKTGPAAAMTGSENSTEIPDSRRRSGYAALPK